MTANISAAALAVNIGMAVSLDCQITACLNTCVEKISVSVKESLTLAEHIV